MRGRKILSLTNNIKYKLNRSGESVIENYNSTKLFSSFFPGIAGKHGIPMWTFYVNRGQCICSMGIEGKHRPIMEFLPANWAYNLVSSQGFRTFIKIRNHPDFKFYEPFQDYYRDRDMKKTQTMIISSSKLCLEEINYSLGLKFRVEYFNIPQDKYAGIVRKLKIKNLNTKPINFECLDGLPLIIPYGLDNNGLKHVRRLFEAFVEVVNYNKKVPFFKGKVKPADRPDVVRIKKGNFYLGFESKKDSNELVTPIVDPVKIFDIRGDYDYPEKFLNSNFKQMVSNQTFENRLPAAMGYFEANISTGNEHVYNSVIGHTSSVETLNKLVPNILDEKYLKNKESENQEILKKLTQKNFISSRENVLDNYARQNFLDNVLRGGFPYTFRYKDKTTTLHLFSRKHGDLERDYNDFRLAPTPYSQGNGNFRDVNQNRRNDLLFNPNINESNIEHFYNFIQLDGFNPLVIKEIRFFINDKNKLKKLTSKYFKNDDIKDVEDYLKIPFTPGELTIFLKENKIIINGSEDEFINELLTNSKKKYDSGYGEGYWTDHWTYNLDLLENFLAVYPERKKNILFENKKFYFYDNPHVVQARDDKYVIWEGRKMQLNSVILDAEKDKQISQRNHDPNKIRTQYGKGKIYETSLFVKILSLIVNKMASLDPEGVGVEMESDKPNWYDALNGLPGLIGSSINETLEIKRHIIFILEVMGKDFKINKFKIYKELEAFLRNLHALLLDDLSPFDFWNKATSLKEKYREETKFGISGEEKKIETHELINFLKAALKKLEVGIEKAWNKKEDIISTYFISKVVDLEEIRVNNENGREILKKNSKGLTCFRAKRFEHIHLPLFLEGPVHFLRSNYDTDLAKKLAKNIRKSKLYDKKLKMYKVNASLADQPMEIGRARTFSPGWFENESIWLHMEYKYMLELLDNELYDEFYKDFKNVAVPFMKPEVYGRSILENSSFIVSSGNPDPSLHGNGFVARLSGATAEFISILMLMTIGKKPFNINSENDLKLEFKPVLPKWLFSKKEKVKKLFINGIWQEFKFPANTFSFMFLGEILIIYHNKKLRNTFGKDAVSPAEWSITYKDGNVKTIKGNIINGKIAKDIRARKVSMINVKLI